MLAAVKANLAISSPVIGVASYSVAFMLGYKLDFSSCIIMLGFGKFSYICARDNLNYQCNCRNIMISLVVHD